MTKRAIALAAVFLAGTWSATCGGDCLPTGPSGESFQFAGSIGAGGLVFHDVVVPSGTDSVNVAVNWGPAGTQVRLIQIDPNCDPTQNSACQRFSDPQGPAPNAGQSINGHMNHQGASMTGRVRFVLQNLTTDSAVSYTATATPQRHGCDR